MHARLLTSTYQINNYELGIVLPLRNQEEIDRLVCWERPPPKYAAGRDEPWVSGSHVS